MVVETDVKGEEGKEEFIVMGGENLRFCGRVKWFGRSGSGEVVRAKWEGKVWCSVFWCFRVLVVPVVFFAFSFCV